MKNLYKTPLITVEELEKKDVLCSSASDTDPTKYDNANLYGNSSEANGLGDMCNIL